LPEIYVLKMSKIPESYMILAQKIIKNTRIFMIFVRKIYKIPEFYMIFTRIMPEFYIISKIPEFYMILAQKIIKNTRIFMIFVRKIYKIPEFYMIFTRIMPEFYIIIARMIFLPNFRRARAPYLPSPTHGGARVMIKRHLYFSSKAEAMVTPRRKYRRPAMVTPKSYPYP